MFIEPHYDDFILSAGMYSFQRPVDKVITIFRSKKNKGGTRVLCQDLDKDYAELKFPNIDWKNPSLLFKSEELFNALVPNFKGITLLLTVLGIGNYAHRFLQHFLVENFFDTIPILFFRDFPHSYDSSKLNHLSFGQYIKDFSLVETVGSISLFNKKIELFQKYYSAQKSLLWFERPQFLNPVPEEVYKYLKSTDLW